MSAVGLPKTAGKVLVHQLRLWQVLGVALILQDRITGFKTPVGTLQTVTAQALADAGDIAKLKTQAEQQTATINLVASEATKAKQLSETVAGQVTEAEKKLTALDAATKAAQATLNNMRQEEDFMMTVLAAQGNDRKSFDKLKVIASDKSSLFAEAAGQAWSTIYEAHSSPWAEGNFPSPWNPGVDPSKFALDQLSTIYQAAPAISLAPRPPATRALISATDITCAVEAASMTRIV
jgi:hypothetical protein